MRSSSRSRSQAKAQKDEMQNKKLPESNIQFVNTEIKTIIVKNSQAFKNMEIIQVLPVCGGTFLMQYIKLGKQRKYRGVIHIDQNGSIIGQLIQSENIFTFHLISNSQLIIAEQNYHDTNKNNGKDVKYDSGIVKITSWNLEKNQSSKHCQYFYNVKQQYDYPVFITFPTTKFICMIFKVRIQSEQIVYPKVQYFQYPIKNEDKPISRYQLKDIQGDMLNMEVFPINNKQHFAVVEIMGNKSNQAIIKCFICNSKKKRWSVGQFEFDVDYEQIDQQTPFYTLANFSQPMTGRFVLQLDPNKNFSSQKIIVYWNYKQSSYETAIITANQNQNQNVLDLCSVMPTQNTFQVLPYLSIFNKRSIEILHPFKYQSKGAIIDLQKKMKEKFLFLQYDRNTLIKQRISTSSNEMKFVLTLYHIKDMHPSFNDIKSLMASSKTNFSLTSSISKSKKLIL